MHGVKQISVFRSYKQFPEPKKYPKLLNYSLAVVFIYSPLCSGLMRIFDWSSYVYAIISLSSCLLLFVLLTFGMQNRRHLRDRSSVAFAFYGFIDALVFGSALAQIGGIRTDTSAMWRQLAMALIPATLFYGCRTVTTTWPVYIGVNRGLIGIATLSFISIGLEFTGLYKIEAYGERYFGFLSDGVSWLLAFVSIVFVAEKKPYLAIASIICLAITQSLGAGIIMVLGTVVLYLFGRMVSRQSLVMASIQLAVGLSVAVFFLSSRFIIYLERLLNINIWDNDRIWTTELSIELFKDSPVYGMGFNSQQYFFSRNILEDLELNALSTPTSTAAKILADSGIVGIIAYLSFVIMVSVLCIKFLRRPILTREDLLLKGLGAWLLVFLWFNHFAAWLLPVSYHATLVFIVTGILAGATERNTRMPYEIVHSSRGFR